MVPRPAFFPAQRPLDQLERVGELAPPMLEMHGQLDVRLGGQEAVAVNLSAPDIGRFLEALKKAG